MFKKSKGKWDSAEFLRTAENKITRFFFWINLRKSLSGIWKRWRRKAHFEEFVIIVFSFESFFHRRKCHNFPNPLMAEIINVIKNREKLFNSPSHRHHAKKYPATKKTLLSIYHSLFSSAIYFLPLCRITFGVLIGVRLRNFKSLMIIFNHCCAFELFLV